MALHRPKINASVLKWARLRSHLTERQVASRIGVKDVERYKKYETGDLRPTQAQLRKIADALDRPTWFFFLNSAPEDEPEPLAMFRRRPFQTEGEVYEEVAWVRESLRRRELALEALAATEDDPPTFPVAASVEDDPEGVASEVRDALGVSVVEQLRWTAEEAYTGWRVAVERAGVIVFHVTLPGAAGFALAEDPLPIIGVSTSEKWATGRQFTLMHELGHVVLGDSTIHSASVPFQVYQTEEERWCNRFAAAVLVPEYALRERAGREIEYFGEQGSWGEEDVQRVADAFNVSPAVMVRRLYHFNLIHPDTAEHLRMQFDARRPPLEVKKAKSPGDETKPLFYAKSLGSWGYFVPEVIFRSYYAGGVSFPQVVSWLRLKYDTALKFEQKMRGRKRTALA